MNTGKYIIWSCHAIFVMACGDILYSCEIKIKTNHALKQRNYAILQQNTQRVHKILVQTEYPVNLWQRATCRSGKCSNNYSQTSTIHTPHANIHKTHGHALCTAPNILWLFTHAIRVCESRPQNSSSPKYRPLNCPDLFSFPYYSAHSLVEHPAASCRIIQPPHSYMTCPLPFAVVSLLHQKAHHMGLRTNALARRKSFTLLMARYTHNTRGRVAGGKLLKWGFVC